MEKVKLVLCKRSCCPTLTQEGPDSFTIEDDNGGKVLLNFENLQALEFHIDVIRKERGDYSAGRDLTQ